ncbi:transcriptional regulator [Streptomyces sp. NPDC003480]
MEAQVAPWDEERAGRSVVALEAAADPSGYRLVWALSERELPVSRLAEPIEARVAATFQDLAELRAAGLVTSRREDTCVLHQAAGPQVRALLVFRFRFCGKASASASGATMAGLRAAVAAASVARVTLSPGLQSHRLVRRMEPSRPAARRERLPASQDFGRWQT